MLPTAFVIPDHFPVYVELGLSHPAEARQNAPQLDLDERHQVDEKIEAGKQKPVPSKAK